MTINDGDINGDLRLKTPNLLVRYYFFHCVYFQMGATQQILTVVKDFAPIPPPHVTGLMIV